MWCFPLQTRLVKVLKASCDPCYFSFFPSLELRCRGSLDPSSYLGSFQEEHDYITTPIANISCCGTRCPGPQILWLKQYSGRSPWYGCLLETLLKQGENGSITIKHTAENQEGPRQRKGTKGRKGSILKLQRLLTHIVFCTAEKNWTLLKNL